MKTRNYGIDFLRIVSMFMIAMLHVLKQGGILQNVSEPSLNYYVAWLLEIGAYCAVDCYGIISGYVCYKSNYSYSGAVFLWLRVLFYSIFVTAVFFIFRPELICRENIIKAVFPIFKKQYWYMTAYFGMYIFIPIINKGIEALNRKQTIALTILTALFFSFIQIFFEDVFILNSGYSVIWLIILYIFGAVFKKLDLLSGINKIAALAGYLICVIIAFLLRKTSIDFIKYTSPPILLSGVFLFLFFKQLKIGKIAEKAIKFFSPLALSVYLIHVHPLIWNNIMFDLFKRFTGYSPLHLAFSVIVSSAAIFIICSIVDIPREWIFKKLKLKTRLLSLEKKLLGNIWKE